MQPVLMLASPVPGLLYVNGRPVGESGDDTQIVVPVSPRGAVYIEHRPMVNGYLPMARRLTMSGGRVLTQSLDDAPGLSMVLWPEGIVECTLSPEPIVAQPEENVLGTAFDPAAIHMEDGSARLIEDLKDTVGHAQLSIFRMLDGTWHTEHTELLWADGAPRWPDTPETTALAAVQAQLLGLSEEANGYCTPAASGQLAIIIPQDALGCVSLKTPSPLGRTAIGLVRMRSPQWAEVAPLYYAATPMGGAQGTWRLHDLTLGDT